MKYTLQELPVLGKIEKIFFVGIKGVGVAPLAMIAKDAGFTIAGSDIGEEFITDQYLIEKKIEIFTGFDQKDMLGFFGETVSDNCLVVTTGAHKGFDNPQVVWAKQHTIAVLTQGQALATFMRGEIIERSGLKSIAIAGSHGKTTISSLLATTLKALGLEPTYTVGTGAVFPLGAPGNLGSGQYFVAEADEYASEPVYDRIPKFLYQTPTYAIFNNIDFDHPDLFSDVSEIVTAFEEFAHNIQSGGILFLNGDDPYLSKLKERINKDIRVVTYGETKTHDYVIHKIVSHGLMSTFTVTKHGHDLGVFELNIPGVHNAKNALAVVSFLSEMGFEPEKIRICLKAFTGTKRRFEIVGKTSGGALLVDDYGHHPLEIATTITAIAQAYPGKKLVCVFQPHTFSRTKSLLVEFGRAFEKTDHLLLVPVFKSQRDTEKDTLSIEEYVEAHSNNTDTKFFETFDSVIEYVKENYSSNEFVILTIGAGDVYKIAYSLKNT